jgi:hypothetical protein
MLKSLTTVVLLFVVISATFAQKHHLTILAGRQAVGTFSDPSYRGYWGCGSEELPQRTFKRSLSSFDRTSIAINYGYDVHNKWRIILGYRHSHKGYTSEMTEFYPSSGKTLKYNTSLDFTLNGAILGTEHRFYKREKLNLGASLLFNPELRTYDGKYHLGSIIGFTADIKVYRTITLQLNPFAEMGLIHKEIWMKRPFGYGLQAGFSFVLD